MCLSLFLSPSIYVYSERSIKSEQFEMFASSYLMTIHNVYHSVIGNRGISIGYKGKICDYTRKHEPHGPHGDLANECQQYDE